MVKEEREAVSKSDESVVSHIMLMRERLERMSTLVQDNLKKAQEDQKTWYDRTARERTLTPGDRVLVLLPTSTSKLLAQWHGSYEVVRQVGRVKYLIMMPEKKKKKGVFHIHMLRKWNEQTSTGYFAMNVGDEEDEMEMLTWDARTPSPRLWGVQASPDTGL